MPRSMPPLASAFGVEVDRAIRLSRAFEIARATSPVSSVAYSELAVGRLERVYELSFLRIFAQWEVFLEEVACRYLCGYVSPFYTPLQLVQQPRTLMAARRELANGRDYTLWHDPVTVSNRVASRLDGCPVETIVRSSGTQLEAMGGIRHRVAHHSSDARQKFDKATMTLAGLRVGGGRAGRFLRREVSASVRWLEHLGTQLKGLAGQMAP